MAALTNLSDIANRLTGGNSGTPQHIFSWIDNRIDSAAATATVAGRMTSLWRYNKTSGGVGAVPGAAAIPDNTTAGGLLQTDPSGGRELWLLGMSAVCTQAGTLILYDRLLHNGGLSGTVATAQTVGGTLTRNTGGVGNQIWVEIYTQIGATPTTITASYTNQAGTSGRTTKATSVGGTGLREGERIISLPLRDGDTGVQAVASVTLAASTLTAGSFGVTIARPLLILPMQSAAIGGMRDCIAGLPQIQEVDTDACLSLAFLANTTTAPQLMVGISMIEA